MIVTCLRRKAVFTVGFSLLLLVLTACDSLSTLPSATPEPVDTPRVQPTPTSTPTPGLTLVPVIREAISTMQPACDGLPSTRLIVQERGYVTEEDTKPLNLRAGPGTDFRIFTRLEVGDVFTVLEGPVCGGDYVWYRVQHEALDGWIAEGDFSVYYVAPYFPG